jgi:DNA-binding transcriptional ArsR family regulator
MPVDFEAYTPDEDEGIRPVEGSNALAILRFLAAEPGVGFTPKEVAEATGLPRGSVGPTLSRLEASDLVRHKEPYWAIAEDDRLGAYAAMLHGLESAEDEFGDDDWGDWQASAVDPRGTGAGDDDG